jgi:hypothetical protein
MDKASVIASSANEGLKNFIIAKMWLSAQDGVRPGTMRVSRDLPSDIVLKPGTTLFLSRNTKREGKMDADFSVSILLPAAVADNLIAAERKAVETRKTEEAEHPY